MAGSLTALFNFALREIGQRAKVALPTERSREAEACNASYPIARDSVLAAAPWTDARGLFRLTRVAEQDDTWTRLLPDPEFQFAYSLPSDFLHPYRLESYQRFRLRMVPFPAGTIKCLMTNDESPILHYTFRNEDVSSWGTQLFRAVGLSLASDICLELTGKMARHKDLQQASAFFIAEARATDANAEQSELNSIAPWHSARGGTPLSSDRFIYPFGPISVGTGASDVA